MRKAAAFPVALLLLSLGCGDDEPSKVEDSGVSAADTGATKSDAGTPTGETRSDASQPVVNNDAGQPAVDPDSGLPVETPDSGTPLEDPDSGIIVISGDAGLSWILAQQCPASTETDPCNVCEDTHCCESYARYTANPVARTYWQCMNTCKPTAKASCEEKCAAEQPTGTSDVAARVSCFTHFCPSECGDGKAPTACATCSATKCSNQSIAANGTESGFLFQACKKACGSDTACQDACVSKYTTGAGLVVLLGECVKTNCATECGVN